MCVLKAVHCKLYTVITAINLFIISYAIMYNGDMKCTKKTFFAHKCNISLVIGDKPTQAIAGCTTQCTS